MKQITVSGAIILLRKPETDKIEIGKSNYYINQQLVELFINQGKLQKNYMFLTLDLWAFINLTAGVAGGV